MDDTILTTLIELGLTSSEARVYLACLGLHECTASQISISAGKERAHTYHSLKKLEQLGIVERTLGTPTRFRPVGIGEAVDHLYSVETAKLRRLDQLRKQARNLLSTHSEILRGTETYSIVKGRVNTYLKMIETIQTCTKEVSLILSSKGLTRLSRFRNFVDVIGRKSRRGMGFRIISEINDDNIADARIFARVAELRHMKNQFVNASIYDRRIGSVALSINDNLDINAQDHVALWTNAKAFSTTLQSFFDSVWFVAAPSQPTIRVIQSNQPFA